MGEPGASTTSVLGGRLDEFPGVLSMMVIMSSDLSEDLRASTKWTCFLGPGPGCPR